MRAGGRKRISAIVLCFLFLFFLFALFVFSLNNLPCGRPWICHYGKRCFRGFVGIGCDTLDRRKLFLFVLNRDVFI